MPFPSSRSAGSLLACVLLLALVPALTGCNQPSELPDTQIAGLMIDGDLDEISGIAASRREDGVLWAIDDSGQPANLYAISHRGGRLATFLSLIHILDSPRVLATRAPTSPGAAEQARRYGIARKGDIATHTGNFGPKAGTLRIDYVLPSRGLRVLDTGVAWPAASAPDADFSNASDHHAVWIDVVAD